MVGKYLWHIGIANNLLKRVNCD